MLHMSKLLVLMQENVSTTDFNTGTKNLQMKIPYRRKSLEKLIY